METDDVQDQSVKAPSVVQGPQGEIIIIHPDGTADKTELVPSDADFELLQRFVRSSAGRTLITHFRTAATYDDLTGCKLRTSAQQEIEHRLQDIQNKEYTGTVSVLFIDLDHFGKINKQYDHAVGDGILVWFASLLRRSTRSHDIIARWGGDEFVVFTMSYKRDRRRVKTDSEVPSEPGPPDDERRASTDLSALRSMTPAEHRQERDILQNGGIVARRIWESVNAQGCVISGHEIPIGVTIGVATELVTPDQVIPPGLFNLLLARASKPVEQAKNDKESADGRNKVHHTGMKLAAVRS